MNIYAMLAVAVRRHAVAVAIRYGGRRLSYREFDAMTGAAAAFLASQGCAPGDRVLLFMRNGFEYPILLLGAMRAGFVAVPVNAKLHPREVAWIAGDCTPKVVVTHGEHVAPLVEGFDEETKPMMAVVEDLDLTDLSASVTAEADPDDPAWIFYTSGTTGRPKGATLTHRTLIAATVNCLADIFDFRSEDRVLHVAPLSHGSGLYMLPSLARGAENIVSDRPSFQPDEILDIVATEKITAFAFVAPTMIVRLLEAAPRDDIGSLRGVIYGGATIHLEHIKAAVVRFGPIFHQLYGQGEAPMTISCLSARDHAGADDEALLSAGYVRAGVEVKLVDSDREVGSGEDGEICVRGDVVMKGYWQNPEATKAALRGGWLHTGDIGHFDHAGRLRVLDRRHDTIISGGTNIYPKEVEDVIASHPGVREVIAFGMPDPEWGESVAVAVVTEDPGLSEAALLSYCKANLASFKKPKRVIFVSELPKNAYGKVLRRTLKDQYASAL
ncbi:class I adenylate-forming enzyme family protein [Rhizobiaceae sp. 2RAB30]